MTFLLTGTVRTESHRIIASNCEFHEDCLQTTEWKKEQEVGRPAGRIFSISKTAKHWCEVGIPQAAGHPTRGAWHAALASSLVSCHGSSLGQCTPVPSQTGLKPSLGKLLSEEVLQSSHSLLQKKGGKQIVQLCSHVVARPSRVPPSCRSSGPTGLSSATVRLRPCHRPCHRPCRRCPCPCRRPCRRRPCHRPSWRCPKVSPASRNQSKVRQLKQLNLVERS